MFKFIENIVKPKAAKRPTVADCVIAQESYVQLLGQWGQIIFLAYFGGRTVENWQI